MEFVSVGIEDVISANGGIRGLLLAGSNRLLRLRGPGITTALGAVRPNRGQSVCIGIPSH